jgi:hypothetical protein
MVLHDDRVEEVAVLLEELAVALRRLKVGADRTVPPPAPQRQDPEPPEVPRAVPGVIQEGSHVMVVRALDRYRGRTGVVGSQRGTLYWNLQLDARGRETEGPRIYKKETSLLLIA